MNTPITEDDTFRVLSSPSRAEMKPMVLEWLGDYSISSAKTFGDFFREHGWTHQEYYGLKNE